MFKKLFCMFAVLTIAISVNASLIAYYNFGTSSPSTANGGTAGAAADGILINGAQIVDIDTTARGVQYALQLNNTTGSGLADCQYMNITNGNDTWYDTAFGSGTPAGARTYAAWVRMDTDTTQTWSIIASKGYETAVNLAAGTPAGNGADQIVFSHQTGFASWSPLKGTVSAMSDTYWIHVVATIDGADYKKGSLYINGVLQDSRQTWGPLYSNDLDLLIGAEPNRTGYQFGWNGMIDDVRIYDEHITAQGTMDLFVNTYSAARPTGPEPATMTLLSPNGGEVLIAGDTYTIGWSSTGSISNVLIEYSTDNGGAWSTVDTVPNTGRYNWLFPAVMDDTDTTAFMTVSADDDVTMTITFYNAAVAEDMITINIVSSATLTIDQLVATINAKTQALGYAPDGTNKNYDMASVVTNTDGTYQLKLTSRLEADGVTVTVFSDTPGDSGDIAFGGTGGNDLTNILTAGQDLVDATDYYVLGSYDWLVPAEYSSQCLVRVSDSSDPGVNDISDDVFTITYNTPPVVSNVTASQRTDGSKLVDIYYDLDDVDGDLCTVSVEVSDDGGSSWGVTAVSLTGDIGEDIMPGTGKHIIWDCGADLPGAYGTDYQVRVYADDGVVDGPAGMVWVYINDPGVPGHESFNGYMSKYETTNAQYCQFLNEALASGDITVEEDNKVYGANGSNGGVDFVGKAYFRTYASNPLSPITYSSGIFSVRSRDGYDMSDHPVTNASWYGATAFCNYYGYRLPTEWEWLAVADYDGSFIYGCGTTIDHSKVNYDFYNPLGLSSEPYTSPVNYYSSYGYGMNDMSGNVWEWTSSLWPAYPDSRVFSGGSWDDNALYCSFSVKTSSYPFSTHDDVGFRVCRDLDSSADSMLFTSDNRDIDLELTSEDIGFIPLPGEPCSPVTISATVWNIGEIAAMDVPVQFEESTGPIGSGVIPRIEPNDCNTVTIENIWPNAGFYLVTVKVDPNNSIFEADETNNEAAKLYQVGDPEDMEAIIDVSIPTPPCYTEGTIANMCGTAVYRVLVQGQPDFTYPVKSGLVDAIITDCHGSQSDIRTRTDDTGQFYFSLAVPCEASDNFTVDVNVTDGTMVGEWHKQFCVNPEPNELPDAWISNITFGDDTIDVSEEVTVSATVCANPSNNETITNIPVTFYAYNLSLGTSSQIGSLQIIDALAKGDCNDVSVQWTPDTAGKYRISARLRPGYSDGNNGNNYTSRTIQVGIFNVSASPYYATDGQVVTITIDSREALPSDELDDVQVLDYSGTSISVYPADPCHPTSTRWIYETEPLPQTAALGRASITVTGTDANTEQHEGYGYFYVVDVLPDAYLNPCDLQFSDLNPDLGENIFISATVNADGGNLVPMSSIPVTFYAQHGSGNSYKIGHTQYTDKIMPGESNSVSISWTNAAEDVYFIEAVLEPNFSDKYSNNNSATRGLFVGDQPFDANFVVVNKTRMGRTLFDYDCKIELKNLSPLTIKVIQFEILSEPNNVVVLDRYVYDFNDIAGEDTEISADTCTLRVDRSEAINAEQLTWKAIYEVIDTCQTMQQESSSTLVLGLSSDITGEGDVDIDDLVRLTDKWLWTGTPGGIDEDIAPLTYGDGIVNFKDFAVLAEEWLK
ncbi:MAG: SUMF1/EgtB/PvdO family nonheme iron enzyme [Planctomycetota bacterium]|jgi:hypothetical protein